MRRIRYWAGFTCFAAIVTGATSCQDPQRKYDGYLDDNYRNYYHIFVRSFADSNSDGIGDLNGITENLDYLRDRQDPHKSTSLGINGIFLSPIHPSPSYHKYDITDYFAIDPQFGTMQDFDHLIKECHLRGIRVILDGVFNHLSSSNPLFVQTVKKMQQTPVCYEAFNLDGTLSEPCYTAVPEARRFRFVEKGKPLPGTYANRLQNVGLGSLADRLQYEGFGGGMVDLDLDAPANRELIKDYLEFWLDRGVDGFRLDAVQSYYGEVKVDMKKNFDFINYINQVVKAKKEDAYIVAEGPWTRLVQDYQAGTEIDSYFNFSSSYRGYDSTDLNFEMLKSNIKADTVFQRLQSLEVQLNPDGDENIINAIFMSNHDIGRIPASFYSFREGGMNYDQLKLFYGLENLISGTFYYYYGDEIGMMGRVLEDDSPCRASFLWGDTSKRPASLKAGEDEQTLTYFEDQGQQLKDPKSLFAYCHDLTLYRDTLPELARGRMSRTSSDDEQLLILDKRYQGQVLKVVVNLAEVQKSLTLTSLDASSLAGSLDVDPEQRASLLDGQLQLPRYSIAFIR